MEETPRSGNLNDNITRVTMVLMALRGGMTQTELAAALGLHKTLVSRSFNGRRQWQIDDVEALARLFDVSPAVFFDEPEALVRSRWFSAATTTQGEMVLA